MMLRLPEDLAQQLGAVARVEETSKQQLLLEAVEDLIAIRRKDPEFQKRLRRVLEEDIAHLERLGE
jgi:hypothetical protein